MIYCRSLFFRHSDEAVLDRPNDCEAGEDNSTFVVVGNRGVAACSDDGDKRPGAVHREAVEEAAVHLVLRVFVLRALAWLICKICNYCD